MRKHILSVLAATCLALPVSAQTLERIKETGELHLGYRTDAAPLSFQKADGDPAGYTPLICVNIAQAIANKLQLNNLQASFTPVSTDDRFERVASGEIDLLCGASTITLSRREIVDFSDPVYVDGTAILQRRDTAVGFPEMGGKKLGVRGSTTTEGALKNSLDAAGLTAEIVTFANHADAMNAMENKEIDAYFADQSILVNLFRSSSDPNAFQVSDEILTIEKQGLALARGDADFRLLVDAALSEMFASGKMGEIFQAAMPGVTPGAALNAMYLLSPTAQ